MGGVKPHLLVGATNGIGLRTTIEYAPSTAFAAADAAAGEPWLTTLPFPVHVVRRVITADEVTGSVLTSRFTYHDGCYDGVEREMRGFAMVERLDSETFATLDRLGRLQGSNVERATAVPPTLTRCWFHTGVLAETATLESRTRPGPGAAARTASRPTGSTRAGAGRAAAGHDDPGGAHAPRRLARRCAPCVPHRCARRSTGSTASAAPRTRRSATRTSSPSTPTGCCASSGPTAPQPAVFHRHLRETLTTAYDRRPTDPRVTHQLTLDVDPASGQPLVEVAVAYPRRTQVRTVGGDGVVNDLGQPRPRRARPAGSHGADDDPPDLDGHRLADAVDEPDHHRAGLAAETTRWELTGFTHGPRFVFDDTARCSPPSARSSTRSTNRTAPPRNAGSSSSNGRCTAPTISPRSPPRHLRAPGAPGHDLAPRPHAVVARRGARPPPDICSSPTAAC